MTDSSFLPSSSGVPIPFCETRGNLLGRPPACSAAPAAVNRRASAFKWLRVACPPVCGARWGPRRFHGGCLAVLLRCASGLGPARQPLSRCEAAGLAGLVVDNASTTIAPTLMPSETSPDTERALADEAAAKAAGFSLRPPVYGIGTAVNATGERNFRQSRREFEALPFAPASAPPRRGARGADPRIRGGQESKTRLPAPGTVTARPAADDRDVGHSVAAEPAAE